MKVHVKAACGCTVDALGVVTAPCSSQHDGITRSTDPGAMSVEIPLHGLLYCPRCHAQHVDEGEWAHRPHHTHLCASCGGRWRVEPYTFGVVAPVLTDHHP